MSARYVFAGLGPAAVGFAGLFGGTRAAKEVALPEVAAKFREERRLGRMFDAFGDHDKVAAVRHFDDRADLGDGPPRPGEPVDKALVDLDRGEREVLQRGVRREARSEVVGGYPDSEGS